MSLDRGRSLSFRQRQELPLRQTRGIVTDDSRRKDGADPMARKPGRVFDLTLPLDQAAEGYKAMDERRATKVLLTL
jgi:hypothetical protein